MPFSVCIAQDVPVFGSENKIPQQKLGTRETFASIGIQLESWRGGLGKAILQTCVRVTGSKVRLSVTVRRAPSLLFCL